MVAACGPQHCLGGQFHCWHLPYRHARRRSRPVPRPRPRALACASRETIACVLRGGGAAKPPSPADGGRNVGAKLKPGVAAPIGALESAARRDGAACWCFISTRYSFNLREFSLIPFISQGGSFIITPAMFVRMARGRTTSFSFPSGCRSIQQRVIGCSRKLRVRCMQWN